MKPLKRNSLMLGVLLCSIIIQSQPIKVISFKNGLAISNQNHTLTVPDYKLNTHTIIGYDAHVMLAPVVEKNLEVFFDLGFTQKGSKTDFEFVTIDHLENDKLIETVGEDKKTRLSFLSFSAGFHLFIRQKKFTPYLVVMPKFDILLNQNSGFEFPVAIENKLIPGAHLGLGASYSLTDYLVFIEVLQLFDSRKLAETNGVELKNKAVSVDLGIRKNIK